MTQASLLLLNLQFLSQEMTAQVIVSFLFTLAGRGLAEKYIEVSLIRIKVVYQAPSARTF